jgi:hypothetical protein
VHVFNKVPLNKSLFFLSDDKSENKCPQNVQNEPGEMSDAVTALVVEEQTQSVPAQVHSNSVNELLDQQPSGVVAKSINFQKQTW